MDTKTLDALTASIAKWEKNATVTDFNDVVMGLTDCPLCRIFHSWFGGPDCQGCPVNESGCYRCGGTPYEDAEMALDAWDDTSNEAESAAQFRKAAEDEVAFLKSLLPSKTGDA